MDTAAVVVVAVLLSLVWLVLAGLTVLAEREVRTRTRRDAGWRCTCEAGWHPRPARTPRRADAPYHAAVLTADRRN